MADNTQLGRSQVRELSAFGPIMYIDNQLQLKTSGPVPRNYCFILHASHWMLLFSQGMVGDEQTCLFDSLGMYEHLHTIEKVLGIRLLRASRRAYQGTTIGDDFCGAYCVYAQLALRARDYECGTLDDLLVGCGVKPDNFAMNKLLMSCFTVDKQIGWEFDSDAYRKYRRFVKSAI